MLDSVLFRNVKGYKNDKHRSCSTKNLRKHWVAIAALTIENYSSSVP